MWTRGDYLISTDPADLDLRAAHTFIASTYWAKEIPFETFEKSIKNSLVFGIYRVVNGERTQVGFARVISDFATFAYLGDVFVAESERGKGLSKWLMKCILSHPELQGLRRFCLVTRDAHALYMRYGFLPTETPENWLELMRKNPYIRATLD
jgi:GNAT superfamily N-acetyltransferase